MWGLEREQIVSPQHGILIRTPEVGGHERLVRAKHLAGLKDGAARVMRGCRAVTYVHLLFDQHQIIRADRCWSESLYPGPMALKGLAHNGLAEVLELFPELRSAKAGEVYGETARAILRRQNLPEMGRVFGESQFVSCPSWWLIPRIALLR